MKTCLSMDTGSAFKKKQIAETLFVKPETNAHERYPKSYQSVARTQGQPKRAKGTQKSAKRKPEASQKAAKIEFKLKKIGRVRMVSIDVPRFLGGFGWKAIVSVRFCRSGSKAPQTPWCRSG